MTIVSSCSFTSSFFYYSSVIPKMSLNARNAHVCSLLLFSPIQKANNHFHTHKKNVVPAPTNNFFSKLQIKLCQTIYYIVCSFCLFFSYFQMAKHAWDNYKLYAWGKNELRPLTKRPHSGSIFGAYDLGATIIDSLDTLYIMGLRDEYQEARDWVAEKFTFDLVRLSVINFELECL